MKTKEQRYIANKKYREKHKVLLAEKARRYYRTVIKDNIKLIEGTEPPTHYESKKCDVCRGKLELSRYKTCKLCKPNIGKSMEESYLPIRESLNFRISELSLLAGGSI